MSKPNTWVLSTLALTLSLLWSGAGSLLAADGEEEFRSWAVPDPLYEELLTNELPGLRSQGSIIWQHILDVPTGRMTARRFAVRYVSDDVYREHADSGFRLVASEPNRTDDIESADRWGLTTVPEGPIHVSTYAVPVKALQPGDMPWLLDPRAIEYYMTVVEYFFRMPRMHMMWGIYSGDEHDKVAARRGVDLMDDLPDRSVYPYLEVADAEVKRMYGADTWGIPRDKANGNPYRWIAYQRWCNDRLRERQRRLWELIKRKNSDMIVVGVDAVPGLQANEWSRQRQHVDVFTHQCYPHGSNWRAAVGCVSKVVSDLTGKEFWPCVHIENWKLDTTPEEVREELSQVFRNGGTGLHLFLPHTSAQGRRVGTRSTYFGSPRRYRTILNVTRLIRTMPNLKHPEYERTGVLFNDDTLAGKVSGAVEATEACYTMLGPVARSWFKFFDCAQVSTWPSLRERFDIIYLPAAKYQRPEIVTKLKAFVTAGGTLVCGDPEAFQTDILGNDTAGSRSEIFGVTVGEKRAAGKLKLKDGSFGQELALRGEAYKLTPGPEVAVFAIYEDGTPAITVNSLGKGRAFLFGSNPFVLSAVPDPDWRSFFNFLVKSLGAPTDLDIWRFRLPDSVIWQEPDQPGVCVTNNRVIWQEEEPHYPQNVDVKATYTYTVAPDAMPDVSREGDIAVAEGRLSDRRKGIFAEKVGGSNDAEFELPESHWMVGWARPDPVSILFDLQEPRPLIQFKLWFCDTMPDITIEGSHDEKTWKPLGKADGVRARDGDVHDMVIELEGNIVSRYLRANFSKRPRREKLSLVEVEIWAKDTAL